MTKYTDYVGALVFVVLTASRLCACPCSGVKTFPCRIPHQDVAGMAFVG